MNGLISSIFSLVLGVIATVFVSNYYYRRSFKSSLTPFIQFSSSPLIGLDPNIRNDLIIKYKNAQVDNLFEIQFLIANTGDKSIKTPIKPLTLHIPEGCELLDANVLHTNPEGRTVEFEFTHEKKTINYIFSLLNKEEFFITKLLLNGTASHEDFKFLIEAEELPPTLEIQRLPLDAIGIKGRKKKLRFEWGFLAVGAAIFTFGLNISNLIYQSWSDLPNFQWSNIFLFVSNLKLAHYSIFLSTLPAFFFLLLGILLMVGAFTDFSFPRKKKFMVPDNHMLLIQGEHPYYHYPFH